MADFQWVVHFCIPGDIYIPIQVDGTKSESNCPEILFITPQAERLLFLNAPRGMSKYRVEKICFDLACREWTLSDKFGCYTQMRLNNDLEKACMKYFQNSSQLYYLSDAIARKEDLQRSQIMSITPRVIKTEIQDINLISGCSICCPDFKLKESYHFLYNFFIYE